MDLSELPLHEATDGGWAASLSLAVARRDGRCVPIERSHRGPLRLLKGFRHPATAGPRDLWEQILVHPPGGIAAADSLDIRIRALPEADLLLTAPGAAKWYGARGEHARRAARQRLVIHVERDACVEWLPMETIVFDGAQARMSTEYHLADGASLFAADLVCPGRPAGAQPFASGRLRQQTRVLRQGQPIFVERTAIDGHEQGWRSPPGLGSAEAFGTLLIVPATADADRLQALCATVREHWAADVPDDAGQFAISALPSLLVVRWRGRGAERGWRVLRSAWRILRASINGHAPIDPRIWAC